MSDAVAYEFWKNFDQVMGKTAIKDFAREHGFDYVRIINQRSDCRLPKLEDACALAHALNTNVEYLLTGEAPVSLPVTMEGMDDIVEALAHATLDERNMVRRLLNIREKGKSSSSREDEA